MREQSNNEASTKRRYGEGRIFYRADRGAWFMAYCNDGKEIKQPPEPRSRRRSCSSAR